MGCFKLSYYYKPELPSFRMGEKETLLVCIFKNTHRATGYGFNAKEKDGETGNIYYGARYYRPDISMWLSVDPMAAKYPNSSPYVFTNNNPINLVDPDGSWVPGVNDDGSITYTPEKGDNDQTLAVQQALLLAVVLIWFRSHPII